MKETFTCQYKLETYTFWNCLNDIHYRSNIKPSQAGVANPLFTSRSAKWTGIIIVIDVE